MARLESLFQRLLIDELEEMFPGCVILKNDSTYRQGVPDLVVLYNERWAMLECKKDSTSRPRPNQPYYVDMLNDMSFAAFIYPENKEEVLRDLQQALRA